MMKKLIGIIFSLLIPVCSYGDTLLTDLVSHWKLNETSDTRADSHGSNPLLDYNTVGYSNAILGNGANFIFGNNETLYADDSTSLSLGADTPFTISFWVYARDADYNALQQHYGAGGYPASMFYIDGNSKLGFSVTNGVTWTTVPTTDNFPINEWHFIVGWHDPDADVIYLQIDNGTIYEKDHSAGTFDASGLWYVGASGSTSGDSIIDSMSFWKRILTINERTSLYGDGSGLDYESFSGGSTPIPLKRRIIISE